MNQYKDYVRAVRELGAEPLPIEDTANGKIKSLPLFMPFHGLKLQ